MNGEDEAEDHTYNHQILDTPQLVSQNTASLLQAFEIPTLKRSDIINNHPTKQNNGSWNQEIMKNEG